MSSYYRKLWKKYSAEMTVISLFLFISVLFSIWLPYYFAQMTLHGGQIAIP